ncbi:MAG: ferric reductase-like transmembrane domain-containing protein [Balneolaceae bacterium]
MRYTYKRGFLWLFIFIILALLPLGIAISGQIPEYRTFWIEFGVGLGFIGLAMFGLQFLFSGRFKHIASTYGMDNIINYHREVGIVAFLLVLAHPVILIIANPGFISYFDPTVNFMRAIALGFVTVAIILIVITSLWRISFGLSYERWRLLHGFLALAIVFVGITHSVQVSHYLEPLWKKIAIAGLLGACMYLVIHTRLVRPWRNSKKPYNIVDIKEEAGDSWTLTLEPEVGLKMNFIAGQFAWITVGPTPWSLQQHPFSIASGSRDDLISFTAKAEGDFTSSWKDMKPGTRAWLEGPFGSFTPEEDSHLFLIMGGIGITPAMSMLRTMQADDDRRKAILIYANVSPEDVTFRKELDELSRRIDLQVVHLLEKPPEAWDGETGLVTEELLDKYLPHNPDHYMYYICGPDPMMDIAEVSLHNLGIPWNRIYTERFKIV